MTKESKTMPYPLHHDDLISTENLNAASALSLNMADELFKVSDLARITAAVVLLIGVCREAGEDPQDVLEQILDTVELGAAKQKGLN